MFRTAEEIERKTSSEFKNRRIKRLLQVREQSKQLSKKNLKSYRRHLDKEKKKIIQKYKREFNNRKQIEIEGIQKEYELRLKSPLSGAHVEARDVHQQNLKKAQDNFWAYMEASDRKEKRYQNAIRKERYSNEQSNLKKNTMVYRKNKVKFNEEMRRRKLHQEIEDPPEGMSKVSYGLISKYMKVSDARNPFSEIANPNQRRKMTEHHYSNTFYHERTKKHQKKSSQHGKNFNLFVENKLPTKRNKICVSSKRTFGHIVVRDDPEVHEKKGKTNGVVTIVRSKPDSKFRAREMKMEVERLRKLRETKCDERKSRYSRALERGRAAALRIKKKKFEEEEKNMFDDMLRQDVQRRLSQIPLKIHRTISDRIDEEKHEEKLNRYFERKFLPKKGF